MRCKNCKKDLGSNAYIRCPYCGHPVPQKKARNVKKILFNTFFLIVSALYIVFDMMSLSFRCEHYSSSTLIISIIVFLVVFPFVFGWDKELKHSFVEIMAVVMSVPFIANWIVTFTKQSTVLDLGGIYTAYNFYILGSLIICDLLLILRAGGVFRSGRIIAWICLALGIVGAVSTVIFYIYMGTIKPFAISIVTINALVPCYTAFHALLKETVTEKSV